MSAGHRWMSSKYLGFSGKHLSLWVSTMCSLQRQTLTVIETCRHMLRIPKRFRPKVDAKTTEAANGILAKVQEAQLNDNILKSINIEADTLNWWTLLYIMELINHYLTKR